MRIIFPIAPLLCLLPGAAAAFHPLITEDTGLLGKGERQVEMSFERAAARNGPDTLSSTLGSELSYGLSGKAELLFSFPWTAWSSDGVSESGPGDAALEAKLEAARYAGWIVALKPGLSLPAGSANKGLGTGRSGFWTWAVAGKTTGPRHYYLNAGYKLNRNKVGEKEDILRGSAAAAYEIKPKTLVSLDLAAETNSDPSDSRVPLELIMGFIWSPSDSVDLDAGLKTGLNGAAEGSGFLAGAAFRF